MVVLQMVGPWWCCRWWDHGGAADGGTMVVLQMVGLWRCCRWWDHGGAADGGTLKSVC